PARFEIGLPSTLLVGGVQSSVTEPVTGGGGEVETALTVIVKLVSAVLIFPSLTLMTMFAAVPAAVGVPESVPELVLKLAHAGLLVMENASVSPFASLALGVKL